MTKTAYLYVIAESEKGPTKLGWSVTPQKRLKQLQTGAAGRLTLYHSEEVTQEHARTLERYLHRLNAHHRVGGEWFDLDVKSAILEVKHVVMRYALELE